MSGNSYEHGYSDLVKQAKQSTPTQRLTEDYGPCWQCNGRKWVRHSDIPCEQCNGTGQIIVRRTVENL